MLGAALIWLTALAGVALIPREKLPGLWLASLVVLAVCSLAGLAVPALR